MKARLFMLELDNVSPETLAVAVRLFAGQLNPQFIAGETLSTTEAEPAAETPTPTPIAAPKPQRIGGGMGRVPRKIIDTETGQTLGTAAEVAEKLGGHVSAVRSSIAKGQPFKGRKLAWAEG